VIHNHKVPKKGRFPRLHGANKADLDPDSRRREKGRFLDLDQDSDIGDEASVVARLPRGQVITVVMVIGVMIVVIGGSAW